jgi:glycine cleavage system regulatory protein
MQTPLVMTVIGKDRPGLVESVAKVIADHGGNWLESRMCRLGGMFAGILRAQIAPDREASLAVALQKLSGEGLTVSVQADQPPAPKAADKFTRLEIVGQDRPGIVRQIAHALASQGVNVEELTTECESAPMSGETLFKATAKLSIPPRCDLAKLKAGLEKIAADLMVDVSLEVLD